MTSSTIASLLDACEKLRFSNPLEAYALSQKAVKKALQQKDLYHLALAQELQASLARIIGDTAAASNAAQSALLYFKATANKAKEANCLLLMGQLSYDSGNPKRALQYYKDAERLVKYSTENAVVRVWALNLQANAYLTLGKPAIALQTLLQSLGICEAHSFTLEMGIVYQGIASFYFLEEEYNRSLEYSLKALPIFKSLQDNFRLCFNYNSLGMTYGRLHEPAKALEYLRQAIQIANRLGVIYLTIWSYSNLIDWYIKTNNNAAATRLIKKLLLLSNKKLDPLSYATLHRTAGSFYLAMNKTSLAVTHFRAALQRYPTSEFGRLQVLENLIELFIRTNDVDKALATVKEYLGVKDELFSMQNQRDIVALEAEHTSLGQDFLKDYRLEQYSRHRSEKNEFIASVREKFKQANKLSSFELLTSQLPEQTDSFDHELYLSVTYQEFMKRLLARYPDLSSTELKVATLLRLSMPSKKIASLLSLSIRTVEYHRTNIRKKLRLKTKDNIQLFLMKV